MFNKIRKYGEAELTYEFQKIMCETPKLDCLFWETTLRCNAKCKHCGSRAGENVCVKDEISGDEVKKVFKEVSEKCNPAEIIAQITGGEPLLREDVFDVMKYIKSLGFTVCMTTNGMLITDEIIEKMKDAGVDGISVSIDGLEKTHDNFRGVPGAYNKSIEGIKRLVKSGILSELQVTTVANKMNIHELEELKNIMELLGIDSWRILEMDLIGRAKDNADLLLSSDDYKYLFEFIKTNRKKSKMNVMYGCAHFLGMDYEKEVRNSMFICKTGLTIASILYNGDIFVCPNIERRPELIQGNIKENNFMDVWENKFEWFRKMDRMKCEKCAKCDDWKYCRGGAVHTWDFDENNQTLCLNEILKKN